MARRRKRIAIGFPIVHSVQGGAEVLVSSLQSALAGKGHNVFGIEIPFNFSPVKQLIRDCIAWRLLDLTKSYLTPYDIFIATKFPSYVARHPNKVVYLMHQHREVYELWGSRYSQLKSSEEDLGIRDAIISIDNRALAEAKSIFTISKRVSERLRRYNGLESKVLYPPPRLGNVFRCEAYEPFVFCPGRLELNKRLDLVLDALARCKAEIRCVIAGTGPQERALKKQARKLKLGERVDFAGWVDDKTLVDLYARCMGVVFAPKDEDLGFITLEAFLSKKPVITTETSGAVLEFVEDGVTGYVASTEPGALAEKIDLLAAHPKRAGKMGEAGYETARKLTWDYVVDHLTAG
ncbi:MAG: glycosyltransferase family 1 protein [Candidatus Coatesbacteria bacterium]|nr:MAG: glycosyltransferase family 1 protein [Candidatus Coatesbacteria bacterium]